MCKCSKKAENVKTVLLSYPPPLAFSSKDQGKLGQDFRNYWNTDWKGPWTQLQIKKVYKGIWLDHHVLKGTVMGLVCRKWEGKKTDTGKVTTYVSKGVAYTFVEGLESSTYTAQ